MNPSLAYGLTFHCPGFTFTQYAVVYWLGSFTGKLLYKFNIHALAIGSLKGQHTINGDCLFFRHDSGSSLVHGPHPKNFCQEPVLFPEDTFQSAKRRQSRKEETVKEITTIFPSVKNLTAKVLEMHTSTNKSGYTTENISLK